MSFCGRRVHGRDRFHIDILSLSVFFPQARRDGLDDTEMLPRPLGIAHAVGGRDFSLFFLVVTDKSYLSDRRLLRFGLARPRDLRLRLELSARR